MALKNLFNNYFYGKPDRKDFTQEDLPTNRLQLFREVLRVRRGSMVGLNLLYLLIWIPAALWTFLNLLQLPAIDVDVLPSLALSYLALLFPLIAITGPFNAGVSFVMRNWARDEHSFPFLDFKKAMRENWKQALAMSAIGGALPLVSFVGVYFYAGMARQNMLFYLPAAVVLLAALLWTLSAQLMPTLIVTYRLKFSQVVKNACILTLAALPRAVCAKLATLTLPIALAVLIWLAPGALSWAGAIALALYGIIMLSFNKLIVASYANAVCEQYLNPKIEGAPVNIGLRPKDEESK